MFKKHLWKSDILSKDAGPWQNLWQALNLEQLFISRLNFVFFFWKNFCPWKIPKIVTSNVATKKQFSPENPQNLDFTQLHSHYFLPRLIDHYQIWHGDALKMCSYNCKVENLWIASQLNHGGKDPFFIFLGHSHALHQKSLINNIVNKRKRMYWFN